MDCKSVKDPTPTQCIFKATNLPFAGQEALLNVQSQWMLVPHPSKSSFRAKGKEFAPFGYLTVKTYTEFLQLHSQLGHSCGLTAITGLCQSSYESGAVINPSHPGAMRKV